MFPTFSGHNDIVVVDALTPIFNGVQAGDVVICVRPVDPSEHIIKRVVAVAGDEVVLYPDKDHAHIRRVKVPVGHVWIQGDNLLHSLDSRVYGPVPAALLRGRVLYQAGVLGGAAVLWPGSEGLVFTAS
ncbi:mitochondrial inner membrane signal peptidase [Haematococcus lacustris]|uniref:Mitochondrial inner membrane signal peptidase n=1 Tax=Haematococcus lacustris TaxID=44745 RepID=A0A699ZLN3_HAELA|nr:mitochondrial inner membrane signal peptidase [Haematococcus lacustris]